MEGDLMDFSDSELNVLQVAIDHMVEHLNDCIREETYDTFSGDGSEIVCLAGRLVTAKRLKERFS